VVFCRHQSKKQMMTGGGNTDVILENTSANIWKKYVVFLAKRLLQTKKQEG